MPRFTTIVAACAALLTATLTPVSAADTEGNFLQRRALEGICTAADDDSDRAYCMALRLLDKPRCTGTVEERLSCLETQVRLQDLEITRLQSKLRRMAEPRIHPLDGLSLGEPDQSAR